MAMKKASPVPAAEEHFKRRKQRHLILSMDVDYHLMALHEALSVKDEKEVQNIKNKLAILVDEIKYIEETLDKKYPQWREK